jgi:ADP-ribose pyrophosphatase YjhB (NUDIX family)
VDAIRLVVTDMQELSDEPALRHHDRLIFDVSVLGGHQRDETDASTDRAAWFAPHELAGLDLMPFVVRALGIAPGVAAEIVAPNVLANGFAAATAFVRPEQGAPTITSRRQRFAVYGLVTDPAGRVLLTRIADGFPGAGRWHLPGGGTDFGEDAETGLLRELIEETNQRARITGLIDVSHRHQHDAIGPELVPIDWHGVRVLFRAQVDEPSLPRVTEGRGGSTAAAAWFAPAEALALPLTDVARDAIDGAYRG